MTDSDAATPNRNERIINTFWAISSAQSDLGRAFARRMKMHPTDAAAIVEIIRAEDRGQPLTPARLAERIGLTSGATSILLNRLEEAGHVLRERGHADRRLVTLHSTPVVHQEGDEFFQALRVALDKAMDACSPRELAIVERFVDEFRTTIDAYARATVG